MLTAAVMLAAAVSNALYDLTSPPSFDLHVVLRKIYSIIAFAIVGYPVARARRLAPGGASPYAVGAIVAAYSAVIEVMQFALDPPWEGLLSNVFDVFCGFLGGYIAALLVKKPG